MSTLNIAKFVILFLMLILLIQSINIIIANVFIQEEVVIKENNEISESIRKTIKYKEAESNIQLIEVNNVLESKNNTTTKVIVNQPLLELEIKKINLIRPIYDIQSSENIIDRNVTIMKESEMPNTENGNLILGAHSGIGSIAYFNDLNKLKVDDEIKIKHNNISYVYKIANIYEDLKDGRITIRRDYNKTTLTLFTCNPTNKSQYLIVIAYQK